MSFVQNNLLLILVLIVSGAMLVWPIIQRFIMPSNDIGTLEATRLINSSNAVLVDVRETKEYEGGRLPNAVHIPLSQLEGRAAELARYTGKPVVAYSMNGERSGLVNKALVRLGFADVYNLKGGFRAWKDAGLPVEK
jgi:rhodanese-related sulfurtransferase